MKKLMSYFKNLFTRDPLKVNYTDKNFMDAWGKLDNNLRARGLVK